MCAAPSGLSLGTLFGTPESSMQGEERESQVMNGPVPYTVVRFQPLLDKLGGGCGIDLSQVDPRQGAAGEGVGGQLTREDAAIVVARALVNPPGPGAGAVCVAGAAAGGTPPSEEEWETKFAQLDKLTVASAPSTA